MQHIGSAAGKSKSLRNRKKNMSSGSSFGGSGAPPPPPPPGRDPQQLKEDLAKTKILMAEARENRLRQQRESQARMAKVRQMYPVIFLF